MVSGEVFAEAISLTSQSVILLHLDAAQTHMHLADIYDIPPDINYPPGRKISTTINFYSKEYFRESAHSEVLWITMSTVIDKQTFFID